MIALIKWTIWQRRWSILWWSVALFAFILINMIFYPTFKDQAAELQKSFDNLPAAAVQLLGGSTDFFSPIGFLNSQVLFLMLPLILSVSAIGLGSSLIAKEENDMTIELLLSRPISRSKLLASKAIAGTIILAIITLSGLLTTIATSHLVNLGVSDWSITLSIISCFLMVWGFGAIAFLFTALGRVRGASIGIASLVGLGGYLVSSLAGTVSWLKAPSKAFPFHYYDSEAVLRGTYNWNNVYFFLAIIVICSLLAWFSFRRRDIF